MKIIFALGNPDQKYANTRHNTAWWVVDALAAEHSASWNTSKFHAHTATITLGGEKLLLVKPTTYYNLVGQSARAIMDFYKLDTSDFLIVHDDLALPLGTLRMRVGGSSGGNNGLKSLESHIGPETRRLRIGMDSEHRTVAGDSDYVLGNVSATEKEILTTQLPLVFDAIKQFAAGDFNGTTHRV